MRTGSSAAPCPHTDAITIGNDGFLMCLDCHAETVDVGRVQTYIRALIEIVEADPVDMALDPGWPARIAGEALGMDPSSHRLSDTASGSVPNPGVASLPAFNREHER